jgi:hypothetical protein
MYKLNCNIRCIIKYCTLHCTFIVSVLIFNDVILVAKSILSNEKLQDDNIKNTKGGNPGP